MRTLFVLCRAAIFCNASRAALVVDVQASGPESQDNVRPVGKAFKALALTLVGLKPAGAFTPPAAGLRSHAHVSLDRHSGAPSLPRASAGQVSSTSRVTMQLPDLGSMGEEALKKLGLKTDSGMSKEEEEQMEERLRAGEMSFDDFLSQSKLMMNAQAMQSMIGKLGGGGAEKQQVEEGQKRIKKYAKYVEVMGPEEKTPEATQLLIDEAKAGKTGKPCPRMQRIADASGATLEEVGRFVLEFSMMRMAANRFAAGESPEQIRESMASMQQQEGPPMNRAMRRKMKKIKKKPSEGEAGFR